MDFCPPVLRCPRLDPSSLFSKVPCPYLLARSPPGASALLLKDQNPTKSSKTNCYLSHTKEVRNIINEWSVIFWNPQGTHAKGHLPGLLQLVPLPPRQAPADPPPRETPPLAGRSGSVSYGVTAAQFPWVFVLTRFCLSPLRMESLFHTVLWKTCNHILLAFRVRFPGDSQALCWIRRPGSLTWVLDPSQQWENVFGCIVFQFVGFPMGRYGVYFYCAWVPPTISL